MQRSDDTSPHLKPMDEDAINREVSKMSNDSVDIHNTGMHIYV